MNIGKHYKISAVFFILPFIISRFVPENFCEGIMLIFFGIALLSYIIPLTGEVIYDLTAKAGSFIGNYIAKIILFFVWIITVLPTGILMKIMQRDRLRLKKSEIKSYWIDNITQNTDYEYQF